jgi:hypothetical protein
MPGGAAKTRDAAVFNRYHQRFLKKCYETEEVRVIVVLSWIRLFDPCSICKSITLRPCTQKGIMRCTPTPAGL